MKDFTHPSRTISSGKDKVDGNWPEIYGEVTRITEKIIFLN